MKIPYVNLSASWKEEKKKLIPIINNVFSKGDFVGGDEIEKFEKNVARLCRTKYAVAFNSGTDALTIGLILLGVKKNDEVITPPNSFISSTTSIWHIGAKPIFVDVLDDQNINPNLIKKAITKKTKAIMPVHLTGKVCNMDEILSISKKYGIPIIEDAAQSIGSKFRGKMSGSFGEIGCFSTHPLKNLNACGDGGFLTTNNKNYYLKAKKMRNHGLEDRNVVKNFGFISRMDTIQAAILNFRMKSLKNVIAQRRVNAKLYLQRLNKNFYELPYENKNQFNTYHTFVIKCKNREKLIKYLKINGIGTAIHYPIPIHLQPAAKFLGHRLGSFPMTENHAKRILTIPIHQNIKKHEINKIIYLLNKFAGENL